MGIITSESGAVIKDIIHISYLYRFPTNLIIYPASVQGQNCVAEIVKGLQFFNKESNCVVDLIIIARGGGI